MKKTLTFLFVALLFIGCKSESVDQTTNFRVFNAVPDVPSLDFTIDFDPYFTNVGYLEGSDYFDIDSGVHTIQANITNSFTALADATTTLQDDQDYTLIVFGRSSDASSLLLRDDNEPAGNDAVKIRLVHGAQATRSVDVYILAPTTSVESVAPTDESLTYRKVTNYLASQQGSYVVTVTEKDSKNILAESPVLTLSGDGVYTIVLSDTAGGISPPRITLLRDR